MVRALGMTVAQVRSMVRIEAFGIGVLGTLIGVGAGVFCGWVVIGSITEVSIPLVEGIGPAGEGRAYLPGDPPPGESCG